MSNDMLGESETNQPQTMYLRQILVVSEFSLSLLWHMKGEKNMFCSQCGTEFVNGACPNCAPQNAQAEEKTYEPDYVEVEPKPKKKKGFAFAIVSMATGIASIVLSWGIIWGLILGVTAMISGSIYKKKNGESHVMVKVGTACGVIGIILQILIIAFFAIIFVLEYALLFGMIFGNM